MFWMSTVAIFLVPRNSPDNFSKYSTPTPSELRFKARISLVKHLRENKYRSNKLFSQNFLYNVRSCNYNNMNRNNT